MEVPLLVHGARGSEPAARVRRLKRAYIENSILVVKARGCRIQANRVEEETREPDRSAAVQITRRAADRKPGIGQPARVGSQSPGSPARFTFEPRAPVRIRFAGPGTSCAQPVARPTFRLDLLPLSRVPAPAFPRAAATTREPRGSPARARMPPGP